MVQTGSVAPEGDRLAIGIPKETIAGERRVSLIPETVSRLIGGGADVLVERGAGEQSSIGDHAYTEAGASVVDDSLSLYEQANLVIKVQAPTRDEIAAMRPGSALIAFLAPLVSPDLVRSLAEREITSFSMDAVPRISRAQSMDAISAMSTIAGYKAVLLAANHLPKLFPLLMTAAGTIAPAKVLVVGAGVAGLQAIATARRLGAVVEAYDTRPVVKEQVESLGAKFVEIDTGAADSQDAGGYAKAASEEVMRLQQAGLEDHATKSDVVITTALVPGKPAPRLIPQSVVAAMRPGSVIVDLAGEAGGNCELSEPGETVVREGVTILAPLNVPSTLPVHASQMYSRTIQNLLALLIKDGRLDPDPNDAIIKGMCITRDGEIVQEQTRQAMDLKSPGEPPTAPPEVATGPVGEPLEDVADDDSEGGAVADVEPAEERSAGN